MYIKGFDSNLCCRDFQFKIGETFDTGFSENLELCTNTVFHFCDSIEKVHRFYKVNSNNRFCEIEVLGELVSDVEKCGSNRIKIVREIVGEEFDILIGKVNGNTGIFNSGYYNSGRHNSGHYNSGDHNSGYYNSGYYNSGNYNSGHYNSGHYNSGNYNSGNYNSRNYSSGFFCNQEPNVILFNKDSGMKRSEFVYSKYFRALNSSHFVLTEFVDGKLIKHSYKDACANWWNNMSEGNRKIVMEIPNFDKEVFKDITGIEV